jgi:FAD/FMN-containing dehydrogenase
MTTATMRALEELQAILGPRGWLAGEDMASFTVDIRGSYGGPALLVARPTSTQEVAAVVRVCARHGIAIVPQGGNTSLCGGAVPLTEGAACIVLSLARMNRIVSVDPLNFTMTVEAGCIVDDIREAAHEAGLLFAMNWGASGSAMIGGAISTNAGGLNVLRFGNTREQVLGLEVVLPDGRVWNGLRALRKDASGYDLKHLFIGAEGTLGVVTRAVLRLHARPPLEQTLYAAVSEPARLAELFALARATADADLTAFELIPGDMVELALRQQPAIVRPLDTRAHWYVLVRLAGRSDITAKLETFFSQAFEAGWVADAVLAASLSQEKNLWTLREEIAPLRRLRGKVLKWDASVPIDAIVPLLARAQECATAIHAASRVIAFGHVGDGNLHLSIWPEGTPGELAFDARCDQIVEAIDELIWALGGSICAEHGVGVENRRRVQGQKTALELELMAAIKSLFDPAGLLNPGKLFNP